jgi:hypothetical protein
VADGEGTSDDPWVLHTPSGGSEYTAYRDDTSEPPALVVQVGTTELRYQLRCLDDLDAMLRAAGDWVPLGNADEQKPPKAGTVEAWARADDNRVGGLGRSGVAFAGTRRSWSSAAPGRGGVPRTTGCAPP